MYDVLTVYIIGRLVTPYENIIYLWLLYLLGTHITQNKKLQLNNTITIVCLMYAHNIYTVEMIYIMAGDQLFCILNESV